MYNSIINLFLLSALSNFSFNSSLIVLKNRLLYVLYAVFFKHRLLLLSRLMSYFSKGLVT